MWKRGMGRLGQEKVHQYDRQDSTPRQKILRRSPRLLKRKHTWESGIRPRLTEVYSVKTPPNIGDSEGPISAYEVRGI